MRGVRHTRSDLPVEISAPTPALLAAPSCETSRWFDAAVKPHEAELRQYLRRRFPGLNGTIDDVVQETYVKLLQARTRQDFADLRPYLFRIARNTAVDHFRRAGSTELVSLEESRAGAVVDERPSAPESLSHAQELDLLSHAIRSLPPRCREIMVLRRLHNFSYQDIARKLGISERTVNAQLAIGLVRCRQYLEERGVRRGGEDV